MPINTGDFAKALQPGVNKWWGLAYQEHPIEYKDLFGSFTSKKAYEEDVLATGFGLAPVKTQGGTVKYDTHQQGYVTRYVNIRYALGYILTEDELDDNQYPQDLAKKRTIALAFSMRQTKENIAANVYNRAFDSDYTGGNGVEMISTAQVTKNGTQSNHLAIPADLSEASIEDLLIQIGAAVNDRGLKISLIGQSLHIPYNLNFKAERILKSVLRVDTANNDINALRNMGMLPGGAMINHYFTDTDAFFIRTNCPDGMKMFQRKALSAPQQDNDFDTANLKMKTDERYAFGWTDWRGVYGSPGV